jgi:hypothetical protein
MGKEGEPGLQVRGWTWGYVLTSQKLGYLEPREEAQVLKCHRRTRGAEVCTGKHLS